MMNILKCGNYTLDMTRPHIMGIVNLTPDSFSGDGVADDVGRAIEHARFQLDAGADLLDVGAESTRPGAPETSEAEELRRLLPVLEEITRWQVPISVDTYKPAVMRAAIEAGATMINDISGMGDPDALAVVADSDCAVCVMHMQGVPGSMQHAPAYRDVVGEVAHFLFAAVERCRSAGVPDERLILDPGFGFGKTLEHNLALFRALDGAIWQGWPMLVGVSRKSMLGQITGQPVDQRLPASLAGALLAAQKGARIIRVHDVAATRDALAVWSAIEGGGKA